MFTDQKQIATVRLTQLLFFILVHLHVSVVSDRHLTLRTVVYIFAIYFNLSLQYCIDNQMMVENDWHT